MSEFDKFPNLCKNGSNVVIHKKDNNLCLVLIWWIFKYNSQLTRANTLLFHILFLKSPLFENSSEETVARPFAESIK